jgi:type I restriction enzyme S subunit
MEGLKKTEIGLLPESWKIAELGKIVDFKTGKLNSNAAEENGIYPFFTCSQETFSINKYAFDQEAILLSGNNARAIYSVKHYKGKFNAYQRTYVISILDEKEYDYDFLNHVLTRQLENLRTISIGSQTKYLTLGMLTTLKIPVPSKTEQRKIAHVLTTVQKAIEQQDTLIRTTTELKKALMQKLFTEGTRGEPQKETEIGLVPESWEVVKIEKCISKTKNRDPRKEPENDFIYVDVSSVSNDFFRIENISKILGKEAPSRARKIIQDGDVIFATVRPTLKRIAKITQDYHNQICSTGYCVLKPDPNKLSQEYLYHYIQTDFFIGRIEKLQRGASYPAVRDTDVKGMNIPLPKLSEQKEIGRTLNILDQRNNILISKKQTLTALFKTLLHELMTGQRRVHELDFEDIQSKII